MTLKTTLEAPATLDGLARLLTAMRTFLTEGGVPATTQRAVHAAMDELLANIVLHGHCPQPPHAITVHLACDDRRIVTELVDNGQPFDPSTHDPDDDDAGGLRIGGVGIRLARHWVDEMRYERREPFNHVTIVTLRQAPSGRPGEVAAARTASGG